MLNKSEKKYITAKVLAGLVIVFFIAMAFINPKPSVQQVEKPFSLTAHAQ